MQASGELRALFNQDAGNVRGVWTLSFTIRLLYLLSPYERFGGKRARPQRNPVISNTRYRGSVHAHVICRLRKIWIDG